MARARNKKRSPYAFELSAPDAHRLSDKLVENGWSREQVELLTNTNEGRKVLLGMKRALRGKRVIEQTGDDYIDRSTVPDNFSSNMMSSLGNVLSRLKYNQYDVQQLLQFDTLGILRSLLFGQAGFSLENARVDSDNIDHTMWYLPDSNKSYEFNDLPLVRHQGLGDVTWTRDCWELCDWRELPRSNRELEIRSQELSTEDMAELNKPILDWLKQRRVLPFTFWMFFREYPYLIPHEWSDKREIVFGGSVFRQTRGDREREVLFMVENSRWDKLNVVDPYHLRGTDFGLALPCLKESYYSPRRPR